MATDPIREIARAAARVKRARRQPVRVRIHPLDWAQLQRKYGGAAPANARVLGVPVELDCAVRRGHPEADYS